VWRLKGRMANAGLWSRVVDRVLRRPLLSMLVSGGLLLALCVPVLGLHTALPGIETFSRDLAVMRTYDRIQAAFPSESIPATVVVKGADVTSPRVTTAMAKLQSGTRLHKDLFVGHPTVDVSPDNTVATIAIPTAGNGTDAASNRALDELRNDLVPATLGQVGGVQADVTGEAAGTRDFNDAMKSHIPYVFLFVLSAAFLLMLLTFRSIVIPIKAILLNLLSVGAAYGVLKLVFQDGHGQGLLGFDSNGAITPWLPLFLFVILFGLSMDYHVFILTRIREAYDSGMSTEEAVSYSIKRTAGTVTSAAAVMIGVFSLFATLSSLELKQMGVGLATAILIDATIIRGVLLPATMKLLGDWNWWLPKWMERMPQVEHEGSAIPVKGPPALTPTG
jgi:putative drug exporter of the RND superfamily